MVRPPRVLAAIPLALALTACEHETSTAVDAGSIALAVAEDRDEWTVPVHLGPEVNSPFRELGPAISPDGLSLYYNSDLPEGLGS